MAFKTVIDKVYNCWAYNWEKVGGGGAWRKFPGIHIRWPCLIRLQNSPYFCVFKYTVRWRTVKPKVKTCEALTLLLLSFYSPWTNFEKKKPTVWVGVRGMVPATLALFQKNLICDFHYPLSNFNHTNWYPVAVAQTVIVTDVCSQPLKRLLRFPSIHQYLVHL